MTNKTAYLISCSDHYGHRLSVTDDFLRANGYETRYITSDFDHTGKKVFTCNVANSIQIHARPYRKNLSVSRILSHREFARDVFRYLDTLPEEPDLLVVLLPPNFLAHYGAKYKKKHPNVKLVFDIFDLWPETFPSGKAKKLLAPAFRVWGSLRDRNLYAADFITSECDLFRQILALNDENSATVYLCGEAYGVDCEEKPLPEDTLELCYLGAINNIIDIPRICELLSQLCAKRPVRLHIIGKGEREEEFVEKAQQAGASVIFYGPVYDDATKFAIMQKCHFGINVMRSTVCVGFTMKSLDYFRYGLPVINSIAADTEDLVRNACIGVQLGPDCAKEILQLSADDCLNMRRNVRRVFAREFDRTVVLEKYRECYEKLL